jgi:hypothetical protein
MTEENDFNEAQQRAYARALGFTGPDWKERMADATKAAVAEERALKITLVIQVLSALTAVACGLWALARFLEWINLPTDIRVTAIIALITGWVASRKITKEDD